MNYNTILLTDMGCKQRLPILRLLGKTVLVSYIVGEHNLLFFGFSSDTCEGQFCFISITTSELFVESTSFEEEEVNQKSVYLFNLAILGVTTCKALIVCQHF